MAKDLYFDHRGALSGLTARGSTLIFTTNHPEGIATAVYHANVDTGKVTSDALPTSAVALAHDAEKVYVAGLDKRVYVGPIAGGALKASGDAFEEPIADLAPVDGGLAVLSGQHLHIVGAAAASFDLGAHATCVAVDPSGQWIAAGTQRGTVSVFTREDRDTFIAAESARLHEGAVTALKFMPDELRFLSGGVDKKLLLTHARGALEAEDRGGRQGHEDAVFAIAFLGEGPEQRIYTGGKDRQVKSWARNSKRPQTMKSAGDAIALAEVTYKERPHLVVGGRGGRLQVIQLDGDGKPVLKVVTIHTAYARALNAFEQRAPERRQAALRTLAAFNDHRALDLVAARARDDDDHAIRVEACTLLGQSGNPHAVSHLEAQLNAHTPEVRLAALTGLRALRGAADLESLDQGLAAGHADVGVAAVEGLTPLAKKDEDAEARLIGALNHRTREVRFAALAALESLARKADPTPSLAALKSRHADLRGFALLRFHQRGLLSNDQVQGALRKHGEDADANVRLRAFQIAVLSRPALAEALRARDKTLHRQLHALQTQGDETESPLPKTRRASTDGLKAGDRRPLIEAMASRALDTCVRGAVALAAIQDPRAFGTLLQLSRDTDSATRVAAARALADQGDARGIARVRQMLRDADAGVRDAAYSAAVQLIDEPSSAAQAGLMADHEDVRQRGLKGLVKLLKKAPDDAGLLELLARALNDSASNVRSEAFKTTVNLPVGGTPDAALRFALRSLHPDIRREVLTEVMGEIAQPWAWPLLLDLFNDPDKQVRSEAFEFAKKKGRGKSPDPLAHALSAEHEDVRHLGTSALATKRNAAARALLLRATNDTNWLVRATAISALTGDVDALTQAMQSEYADVRIRAAAVLARAGDEAAAAPLMAQLAEAEPDVADLEVLWRARVIEALNGLAELGHAPAAPLATGFIGSNQADLRRAAADALAWTTPADDTRALHAALRHSDAQVKQSAALGLAWLGDPSGLSILTPPPAQPSGRRRAARKRTTANTNQPPADAALFAALALNDRDRILAALDSDDRKIRTLALRLILMIEWREGDAVPDWCLAALSSQDARVRLEAARALESFGDPAAFEAVVLDQLNPRDRSADWDLSADIWRRLADAIALGTGRFRVRAARLLTQLDTEQEIFEGAWADFDARFGATLDGLKGAMPKAKDTGLGDVVFGAYVGLSRIGGNREAQVRFTALSRIAAMAAAAKKVAWDTVGPVLLQAILDGNSTVRVAAFDHLAALGYPRPALAAEALGTGHRDVGVRGLSILASDAGAEGEAVLTRVLTTYTDGLEHEAAKLLSERVGVVAAMQAGFEAQSADRRRRSVTVLMGRDDARDALIAALDSRFRDVRSAATLVLAGANDPAAFDPLTAMLREADDRRVSQAINALATFDDPRVPDVLLDRLAEATHSNAAADALLTAVGRTRRVSAADRVMALYAADTHANSAFNAALTLSGYDQYLGDFDAVHWLKDQHPRHDALLARLLTATYDRGEARHARQLIEGARWAKGAEVDAPLAQFATFHDAAVRRNAIEAIAWRARERDGAVDALVGAVSHDDPTTAFLAAEGLALVKRSEGVSVLLSAVELSEDFDHRGRAVKALGVLSDPRGIDVLIGLAANDEHALQESAAEAIGHLAHTEQAEAVFTLLDRLSRGDGEVALNALTGLRYYDTREGWARVRDRAEDDDWSVRERVAELLAFHDDDLAREALLERVRKDDDWDVVVAAVASLRTLNGPDDLAVDYALLQSDAGVDEEDFVQRIAERGAAADIFAVLPKIDARMVDEYVEPLVAALMSRDPLPIDAAASALSDPDHRVGAVASRIIGRAGAGAKAHAKALVAATDASLAAWQVERSAENDAVVDAISERLRQQIWACSRLATGDKSIVAAATLGGASAFGRVVRAAAIEALADGRGGKDAIAVLRTVATGPDAALRALAASALADRAPKVAEDLLPETLSDRATLDRLLRGVPDPRSQPVLRDAAQQAHAQGVALPHLIARGDADGLAAVATDSAQDLGVRAGAIEALARIASAAAQATIAEVGKSADDEELQKTAWRALRRAKRNARAEVAR